VPRVVENAQRKKVSKRRNPLSGWDLVDCGRGQRDRVFFDEGEDGDKVVRCEIKNPG
jgi:hypothetical protein